uniref:Uncharacterized protein n=1 Tax=Anopheles atroparvus TaxID=41427 RepID=A0A182J4N2_ANOAO
MTAGTEGFRSARTRNTSPAASSPAYEPKRRQANRRCRSSHLVRSYSSSCTGTPKNLAVSRRKYSLTRCLQDRFDGAMRSSCALLLRCRVEAGESFSEPACGGRTCCWATAYGTIAGEGIEGWAGACAIIGGVDGGPTESIPAGASWGEVRDAGLIGTEWHWSGCIGCGLIGPVVCVVWCTPVVRRSVLQCRQEALPAPFGSLMTLTGVETRDTCEWRLLLRDVCPPLAAPLEDACGRVDVRWATGAATRDDGHLGGRMRPDGVLMLLLLAAVLVLLPMLP